MTINLRDEPIKFNIGDRIVDSRCGASTTGTVTQVRGTSVYYRDGCMYCRGGAHHRTQTTFSTTSKAP
ncbi:hypothetical protein AB0D91_05540 [Streptomyces canus]|uniref:hypothetical protein n=1 Tax=Streptomyces canus TaxID=58343 RepID=UPI0033EA1218